MKVYITKFALTHGMAEGEAELWDNGNGDTVKMLHSGPVFAKDQLVYKPNWHETIQDAVERAEVMRRNKIKSLHRTITKLEKMVF